MYFESWKYMFLRRSLARAIEEHIFLSVHFGVLPPPPPPPYQKAGYATGDEWSKQYIPFHLLVDCLRGTLYLIVFNNLVVLDCLHTRAKCIIWILIQNAHFELNSKYGILDVCTPNYIAMCHLKCAFQMTVRRYFPVMQLANHDAKSPYECP